ncbi:hypothetical protein Tco_0908026 [Tanacetum coccineum]|uniref:MULE transposase domain-containing protein n=1 Tax=Tanacetum coccineum TaxID=301880 RepID=A0ABQ5CPG7_9ASTR
MRLRFKICKVGSHSNDHVADADSNHALAEELGNTIVDSDDEYIPGFMDEEDGSDQCFGSGNSTESEGSMFEGEDIQPITKERKYYYKQPNDPRDIHFEVGQIFLTREQFRTAVNETQSNWKLDDIKQEIFATCEVSVSQNMCMKARKIVRNDLVGGMVAHYAKLWDYKEELDKTNPGSTFEIRNVDGTPGEPRDANDQMYPVAWAVVQVENNDTWSSFLRLLILDLGMIYGGQGWTLITDQQKIAKSSTMQEMEKNFEKLKEIDENAYEDLKERGVQHWCRAHFNTDCKIAKSSTMQEMEKNFEKLKEIDENAYEELKERGVQHWCRAHFNTDCKVASVDNNLAESWNWSLVELRGKPIIYILDDIRRSLMERIYKRRDWMYKKEIVVCTRIVKKLR